MALSDEELEARLVSAQGTLRQIVERAQETGDCGAARGELTRWKESLHKLLGAARPAAATALINLPPPPSPPKNEFLRMKGEVDFYKSFLLAIRSAFPENPAPSTPVNGQRVAAARRRVFIIHGHDHLNREKLQLMLDREWNLEPVVLWDRAWKGRVLIDKFEEEASTCEFAIAILTPDDMIQQARGTRVARSSSGAARRRSGPSYSQARPNVIFEIGWFFGKLGRERVLLLSRRNVEFLSDLDGLQREQFDRTVAEVALSIKRELAAAGLIAQ